MKTLTSPVSTPAAATQSGWCELYDIYLAASIVTPFGTTNILRLCTVPGGISFFSPNDAPEPSLPGYPTDYSYWPMQREVVKGDAKFQDDKLQITASNVTAEWSAMLDRVNWYDTPIVIRKVPLNQAGLTTNDCLVIFSGLVDTIAVTAQSLQINCSSSLGTLSQLLPVENMHASCRFRFGDDLCTQIKWLPENYVAGTCDSGSSTTNVKSAAAFSQDTGTSSGYGTDLVDALANASISASSEFTLPPTNVAVTFKLNWTNVKFTNDLTRGSLVIFSGTTMPTWKQVLSHQTPVLGTLVAGRQYKVNSSNGNSISICEYDPAHPTLFGTLLTWTSAPAGVKISGTLAPSASGLQAVACSVDSSTDKITIALHGQTNGTAVTFAATTMPSPLTAGTVYFIVSSTTNDFKVSLTNGGLAIDITSTGSAVTASTFGTAGAYGVKVSNGTGWAFTTDADWGTQVQGYYQIPDAQAGLQNAALKPYIQFDFGSAVTPKLWRVSSFAGVQAEQRLRMIQFFSSTDNSTWKFESYFEMPNIPGVLFDVLIPKAQSARYWRICVRSRWAESLYYLMFNQVSAYAGSRNWWLDGYITFNGNVTAALAGVSRPVRRSFSGEIFCAPLPAAPAAGDTFVIQRGCARTFNACCARLNTENYGGFNDLELQNIVNFRA